MPWTGETFRKHNHALHGARAEHAARQANAILRSGAPEGVAIATANKYEQTHHADGGAIKHSKESVQYGHGMPKSHCGICTHFRAPHGCNVVAGEISPQGWCKLFQHRGHAMGGPVGYDGGGMIDPTAGSVALNQPALGGMTPSPLTESPLYAQSARRYQQMPQEKLQELSLMMGNSPQGMMAKRALMQKQMMPHVVATQQPGGMGTGSYDDGGHVSRERRGEILSRGRGQSPQTDINLTPTPSLGERPGPLDTEPSLDWLPQMMVPDTTQVKPPGIHRTAAGGAVEHRLGGGMLGMGMSEAEPWWTRSEARSADAPMSGYLHGATAGRADALKGTAASDSYILPAEEIAGLGEGNSLMGARVIQSMLNSGPHGIPQERQRAGRGLPHPPSAQEPREFQAKGGGVQHHEGQPTTKVALSHGEYSMSPEEVMRFTGQKDRASAMRVMDLFTMELRKRHIKDLKGLKPPVGMKK